jgi:isopentenyl diphosphate isomerase/L-lactate dehydrogenase-like FMN-dependent dehydrogenase
MLSNHGGRQLDTAPSSLEVALEIHQEAPEIFDKIEVYADGGVRYGTDVLKLLALGVKAVGLGRPFAYANVYGYDGVKKAIEIMKREVAVDAANLGVDDLQNIDPSLVSSQHPEQTSDKKANNHFLLGKLEVEQLGRIVYTHTCILLKSSNVT